MGVNDTHPYDLLEEALAGGLDAAGTRKLKAHLAGCPGCARDLKFARREREALAGLSGGLSARELNELSAHTMEHLCPSPAPSRALVRRSNPYPVLALSAAMAAAVLVWFGVRSGKISPASLMGEPRQAALSFGIRGRAGGEDFLKGRDSALARLGIIPRPGSRAVPIEVNGFESIADLAQVNVSGYAQPELVSGSHSGNRALRLSRVGSVEEPTVLTIAIPPRRHWIAAQAVSAWVKASGSPVSVALLTEAGESVQRVEPGPWTWVLLQVPPGGNCELEKRGITLGLTGAGAMLLDGIELWCVDGALPAAFPVSTTDRNGG